jgi:GAF domain-containing protein
VERLPVEVAADGYGDGLDDAEREARLTRRKGTPAPAAPLPVPSSFVCSASQYDRRVKAPAASARESRILYRIISTVSSSLDLGEVLRAVVGLLTDAAGVHACFVYLPDEDGSRLVLKAAGEPYSYLVDEVTLARGEGLAWWVTEHREPAFIREAALDDPRVKYVPELEEEKFQSLVSVPILGKDRAPIGVISLHTEAPREFTEDEVELLVSTASLVGGAIENARVYEEMRRRVSDLEHLTALGEAIARAETLDELLPAVAARTRELLRSESCQLYMLDRPTEQLRLRASAPPTAQAPPALALSGLGPELSERGKTPRVAVPLVASEELLGLLHARGTAEVELARAVANQTAVAIKKIELIERLTEKNLIKDFFEQLAGGSLAGALDGRAARLGCDLEAGHLVLAASPADDAFEKALRRAFPGSLFDPCDESLRGLLRVPPGSGARVLEKVRALHTELGATVAIGLSNVCRGPSSFPSGFEEARHALLGTTVLRAKPSVMAYEELGPYKYLLRISLDSADRDAHRDAVTRLADYDRARSTSLLHTLEEFLRRRGNISATADALYIHPNTLRQRLRRILELSGLDLRKEDWLMVEIAVKLVRLELALETAAPDISVAPRL